MSWGVGESTLWGVGEFTGGVVNAAPVVTPPSALNIQFANGGAGLSKTNAQLVAWGQSGSGTDAEDGAIVVAADFSALPATIPAGTYSIPFRSAADSGGLTGVAYADLIVSEAVAVNAAPVSSGNYSSQSATVGVAFTAFNAAANFSDPGDTLNYTATGLPPGLTINYTTGLVTGTPATAGGYTATITATDSVGQPATALLPVVVAAAGAVLSPSIRNAAWPGGITPILDIGDSFRESVTLLHGLNQDPFDFSGASVSVVVVAPDLSEAYCDAVEQSPTLSGANWAAGELVVYLRPSETAPIAERVSGEATAKLEVQVAIGDDRYTWRPIVRLNSAYIQ